MAKHFYSIWLRWKVFILWCSFFVLNLINLILVFRSLPVFMRFVFFRKALVGVSRVLFLPLSLIFLVLLAVVAKNRDFLFRKKGKLFMFVASFIFILVSISFFYFSFQDFKYYPNYTFSKFYIYLPSLRHFMYFQFLVFFVLLTNFFGFFFRKLSFSFCLETISFFVIVLFIFLTLLGMVPSILSYIEDEFRVCRICVFNKGKCEDPDFAVFKKQLNFVKSVTPESSVIIHPTQSNEFPLIGNQPLIRHSLYPRRLLSAKFATGSIKDITNETGVYYIFSVYSNGDKKVVFPDYELEASEVVVLYSDGRIERMFNLKYFPGLANQLGDFDIGLIRIK